MHAVGGLYSNLSSVGVSGMHIEDVPDCANFAAVESFDGDVCLFLLELSHRRMKSGVLRSFRE